LIINTEQAIRFLIVGLAECGKIDSQHVFSFYFSSFIVFDRLIFGVLSVPEFHSRLFRAHLDADLHRGNYGGQVAPAHQIVGSAGEGEDPIHFAHAMMANFPHQRDRLQPAEALFDALPLPLAGGITRMSRGAVINRTASRSRVVLRHMRRDLERDCDSAGRIKPTPEHPVVK
jgi:hypothetical protein